MKSKKIRSLASSIQGLFERIEGLEEA